MENYTNAPHFQTCGLGLKRWVWLLWFWRVGCGFTLGVGQSGVRWGFWFGFWFWANIQSESHFI